MQSTSISINPGDTLSSIASQNGTSVNAIMAANPSITDANKIQAGAKLTLPAKPTVIQTTTAQRGVTAQNVSDHNAMVTNISNAGNPTPPVTPSGSGSGGAGGAGGGDTNSSTDPITGQPSGAVGFKYDAGGNRTWVDASGNPLAASSDSRSAMTGKVADIQTQGSDQIRALTSTLQNALAYTNSIGAANIQQIMQMYQARIGSIQESTDRQAAQKTSAGYRTGLNRYAPDQAAGVVSEVEQIGQQRIVDLITKMNDAVTKAQSSLQAGDMKAFNDTSNQIKGIQKNMSTEINNLYKEAQQYNANLVKTAAQANKDAQQGINTAKADAPTLAAERDQFSTEAEWKSFLGEYAKERGLDPDVLSGEVQGYMDTQANKNKPKLGNSKQSGGGKDGAYTYTGEDVGTYSNFLNKGGTAADGTAYNARGSDGFVDPGSYIYAYNDWIGQGGTPKGFLKQFPVTNVNPASYSTLPAALQPKPAKSTAPAGTAAPGTPTSFKPDPKVKSVADTTLKSFPFSDEAKKYLSGLDYQQADYSTSSEVENQGGQYNPDQKSIQLDVSGKKFAADEQQLVMAHEMLNALYPDSPAAKNAKQFNADWESLKATTRDPQVKQLLNDVDNHMKKLGYDKIGKNSAGDDVMTSSRFSYLGQDVLTEGKSWIPSALQKYYAGVFK